MLQAAPLSAAFLFPRSRYRRRQARRPFAAVEADFQSLTERAHVMAHSTTKVSPFAPKQLADMPAIEGVRFAACEAGIRYRNRKDLMVTVLDLPTAPAAAMTEHRRHSTPAH